MRRSVTRIWLALLAVLLAVLPIAARAQAVQQTLVDRATLAVQEMLTGPDPAEQLAKLRDARAVMICPRVFQAGLVIGGSGGGCVLVARDGAGSWSSPAFYTMSSASLGLQIGIQDSEIMMMIMTDRGLSAVMDTQFKIGGDASIAVATAGEGVGGASTGGMRADIFAYAQSRGLYAGISLAGTTLTTDTDSNLAYYGRPLGARGIVVQMDANNPGADPLRAILGRFGAPMVAVLPPPTPMAMAAPARTVPIRPVQHAVTTPVLRQTLPPPPPPPPR